MREQFIRTLPVPPGYDHLISYVQDSVINECATTISSSQFQWLERLQQVSTPDQNLGFALQGVDMQLVLMKESTGSMLRIDEQNGLATMYEVLYNSSIVIKTSSAFAVTSKSISFAG